MMRNLLSPAACCRTLAVLACLATGASSARAQCLLGPGEIVMNGRLVRGVDGRSLLDLVRRDPRVGRLEPVASLTGVEPTVFIDGMPAVGGVSMLTQLGVEDADSLTILDGFAAAVRFGPRAGRGAIVVTTKRPLTATQLREAQLACLKAEER
jgi:hypothetical protein